MSIIRLEAHESSHLHQGLFKPLLGPDADVVAAVNVLLRERSQLLGQAALVPAALPPASVASAAAGPASTAAGADAG